MPPAFTAGRDRRAAILAARLVRKVQPFLAGLDTAQTPVERVKVLAKLYQHASREGYKAAYQRHAVGTRRAA